MKLRQGNIFTSVCQEFCPLGGGGRVWQGGMHGRGWADMHGRDCVCGRKNGNCIAIAGTHPTGMHSCSLNNFKSKKKCNE